MTGLGNNICKNPNCLYAAVGLHVYRKKRCTELNNTTAADDGDSSLPPAKRYKTDDVHEEKLRRTQPLIRLPGYHRVGGCWYKNDAYNILHTFSTEWGRVWTGDAVEEYHPNLTFRALDQHGAVLHVVVQDFVSSTGVSCISYTVKHPRPDGPIVGCWTFGRGDSLFVERDGDDYWPKSVCFFANKLLDIFDQEIKDSLEMHRVLTAPRLRSEARRARRAAMISLPVEEQPMVEATS
jgi:hypothetical protein